MPVSEQGADGPVGAVCGTEEGNGMSDTGERFTVDTAMLTGTRDVRSSAG